MQTSQSVALLYHMMTPMYQVSKFLLSHTLIISLSHQQQVSFSKIRECGSRSLNDAKKLAVYRPLPAPSQLAALYSQSTLHQT